MRHLLALLALGSLSGCFLSSGTDDPTCTAYPACDGTDVTVESCDGTPGCYEASLCGVTISCAPADTCGAIPVCNPDESEISGCREGPDCRQVTLCGTTIYCVQNACDETCPAGSFEVEVCEDDGICFPFSTCDGPVMCRSEAFCEAYPACPPNMREVPSCDTSDPSCTTATACGSTIYCLEEPACESSAPCFDATSELLESGPGACLDITSPGALYHCYEQELCGALHHCVTTCPQGDFEISGPAECEGGLCSVYEYPSGPVWCTGGDACRAIPTCESWEVPVDLLFECDDFSECRFVSVCGTTIQCRGPGVVVG